MDIFWTPFFPFFQKFVSTHTGIFRGSKKSDQKVGFFGGSKNGHFGKTEILSCRRRQKIGFFSFFSHVIFDILATFFGVPRKLAILAILGPFFWTPFLKVSIALSMVFGQKGGPKRGPKSGFFDPFLDPLFSWSPIYLGVKKGHFWIIRGQKVGPKSGFFGHF